MSDIPQKDWKTFKENSAQKEQPSPEVELDVKEPASEAESEPSLVQPTTVQELEERAILAEKKAREYWDKLLRIQADLDNVRRRAERDVAQAHLYGLEKFSTSVLTIVDSLEQALNLADAAVDSGMHEGLTLTMKLFLDVLAKFEVKQVDPVGLVFDPNLHEAISVQAQEGVAANTVLMVLQKGYTLNGRLIRPARVMLAQ